MTEDEHDDDSQAQKVQLDRDNAEVERTLEVGARFRYGGSIARVEETDGDLVTLRRAPGHWAFNDGDRTVVAHRLSLRPVRGPLPLHAPYPWYPGEKRPATAEVPDDKPAPEAPAYRPTMTEALRDFPPPPPRAPKPAPMPLAESPFRRAIRLSRKAPNA